MEKFSINNYNNLSEKQKAAFNNALAHRLSSYVDEIKRDDDLKPLQLEKYMSSSGGNGANASMVVSELYSKMTSGIQAGSGDQSLFLGILNAFVEAWSETI